ncbi:hypothetical protein [Pyramidobacter sp.]|uniref:hypothetical protein n=1 Tax=Pyramidobacter sp. TaxID=1943581 RepID=UPI00331A48BD
MKLKPKYLGRLTRKQWLALHRACFTESVREVADVEFWDNGKGANVAFLEKWDDDNEDALLLDTNYRYMEFDPPLAVDVWDGEDSFEKGKCFFKFMLDTFGKEYVVDYMQYRTGVDVGKYLNDLEEEKRNDKAKRS